MPSLPISWIVRFAVAGAALRFLYLVEQARSVWFTFPVLDELYYLTVAEAMAAGDRATVALVDPGFRPLLYPALLAALRRAADAATVPFLAVGLQHLLGLGTLLLCGDLATRLHGRRAAGPAAATLLLLAAPPLYFEGEILITTLFTFFVTLAVWLPVRAPVPGAWIAAASVLALAAQARPNALLALAVLPVVVVAFGSGARSGSSGAPARRASVATAAGAVAAAVVVLFVASLWQQGWWGHRIWLPTSGGVNLYLGNERGADGREPRQDEAVTWGDVHRDSVQLFAERVGRRELADPGAGPRRLDRYWKRRTLEEIRTDPGRWIGLMLRKVGYLLSDREAPNNRTWDFAESESRILPLLPVSWGVLLAFLPLGGVAAATARRAGRAPPNALPWLVATTLALAAGVLAVFVAGRYRIPLWPLLAALAGGGLVRLIELARERRWGPLLGAVAIGAAVCALSFGLAAATEDESPARDLLYRSQARWQAGDLEGARRDAAASLELAPEQAVGWFHLGTIELSDRRWDAAGRALLEAARRRPDEPRILVNLGVALEHLDRPDAAYSLYRRAIDLGVGFTPPLVNAALLELRAGELERAAEHLERARELGADDVVFLAALGALERERGREGPAGELLDRARRLDPERTRAILDDLERPLDPRVLAGDPAG